MGKDMKYLDVAEDNAAKAATESGTYSGSYGDKIDTAINSWLSNRGFDYNTSNDKDYQKYVEQYKDNTQTGAQLSRQTAAQLANGYEPSYADIVAGEVANKQMENVSDAVPTYKQMAQLDYNAEQNRLANAGNIYSQLDSTNYSRNRDLTQDYKNQLKIGRAHV